MRDDKKKTFLNGRDTPKTGSPKGYEQRAEQESKQGFERRTEQKTEQEPKTGFRPGSEQPPGGVRESEIRLSDGEYRLMDMVWEREPVLSTELVKMCFERLGWKKSTVYTVLKRLNDKGVINSENAMVTARIGREFVNRLESEALLEKSFGGSLPDFFAAFLQDRKLTREEADRIQDMIREAVE